MVRGLAVVHTHCYNRYIQQHGSGELVMKVWVLEIHQNGTTTYSEDFTDYDSANSLAIYLASLGAQIKIKTYSR